MSDIFISYSRRDIAYARLLHNALKENDLETWIDWQDIPPSAEWLKEVFTAIEEANIFIFILSASSNISDICQKEIDHARENNKRIIPIVIEDVEPAKVHPALSAINWIFSRTKDELQPSIEKLIEAIQTDYDWVKAHTRLQIRALEWKRADCDKSFLLQGTDLSRAENWLVEAVDKEPKPTLQQTRYIQSSRQGAIKRQRNLLVAVGAALAVMVVLSILAVINSQRATQNAHSLATQVVVAEEAEAEAVENARLAHIRELTMVSQQNGTRFDQALLLGLENYNIIDNYQTQDNIYKLAQRSPEIQKMIFHKDITGFAFSADGKILVTSSGDTDSIIFWDTSNGQSITELQIKYSGQLTAVNISQDGKTIAVIKGGKVILIDMRTQEIIAVNEIYQDAHIINFSPDGKLLAFAGGQTFNLWNVNTLEPITTPFRNFAGYPGYIAFSPDGKTLAYGTRTQEIRVWDIEKKEFTGEPLRGHMMAVMYLAFSPDGKILASGSEDGAIILWNTENFQPIGEPLEHHTNGVTSMDFSPDGIILAVGSWDRTISLWDVSTRQLIRDPLEGHVVRVSDVRFSPNGDVLASASEDGAVILWDLDKHLYIEEIYPTEGYYFVEGSLSADSRFLAAISEKTNAIEILNTSKDPSIRTLLEGNRKPVSNFAFSIDHSKGVSVDAQGNIMLWDITNERWIAELMRLETCSDEQEGYRSCVNVSMVFNPAGTILAIADSEEYSTVYLWDAVSGQPIANPLQSNISNIIDLAFSADGNTLVASSDSGLYVWDVNSKQNLESQLNAGHVDWIMDVAFSPNGDILASADRAGNIIFWSTDSLRPIGEPVQGYLDGITSIAFSPDGNVLAAGFIDGTILYWDVDSQQPLGYPLQAHKQWINNLIFSPDGKILTSISESGEMFVWDADLEAMITKNCERVGRNFTREEWVFYFPDEPYRITCEQWPEG